MANSDTEVVIVGGGAAGIAAGRRLAKAAIDCLVVEARPRLGGRAWTVTDRSGFALDLGCGWLHSADRNPWATIAKSQGRTIDKSPPPWTKPALPIGFPPAEQEGFRQGVKPVLRAAGSGGAGRSRSAGAALLEPGGRWNNLIDAVGTYISGAELDRVSARDFDNYADNGVNWRVLEGYGATIAAYGEGLPVVLDCPVLQIDHRGKRLKIETAKGVITADQAIVTLPSALLADKEFLFAPALPGKPKRARPAARAWPTSCSCRSTAPRSSKRTAACSAAPIAPRPPLIICGRSGGRRSRPISAGRLAGELEAGGEGAFFDFAVSELKRLLGGDFIRRVKPLHMHRWGADPFARGSYSYALPGMADCRATLAAPVDDRLFFAGEACSSGDFSTAHGGWITGVAAAEQVIAARRRSLGGRINIWEDARKC